MPVRFPRLGVKPDIICLAKAINAGYIPLGATVISRKLAAAWDKPSDLSVVMHGYTYSGHPLGLRRGECRARHRHRRDLPGNAARQGAYMLERLADLPHRFRLVGEVRGKGLMAAIELVEDDQGTPSRRSMQSACCPRGMREARGAGAGHPQPDHPLAAAGDHRGRSRHDRRGTELGVGGSEMTERSGPSTPSASRHELRKQLNSALAK